MARADGNGKRIQLRGAHEFGGLIGIGQKLIAGHLRIRTVTVFLVALHGFKGTQASQFAFDGHPDAVGVFNDALRHLDVVVVACDRLAVAHQRAVHHHGRKAHAHGDLAHRGALAVILVHADGDVGPFFHGRFDHVL